MSRAPGNPTALEWWHYQHTEALGKNWGDLLKEVGFSDTVLRAPAIPTKDDQPFE